MLHLVGGGWNDREVIQNVRNKLGGIPCIHGVCVYQNENKDPRLFVEKAFIRETFLNVYKHYFLPIGGPVFWPKTNYTTIEPPEVRVLPGRPKRNRNVDPQELREKAERAAAEKQRQATQAGSNYKKSRKGAQMTCQYCKVKGHNKRTCGQRLLDSLDGELGEEEQNNDGDGVEENATQPAREAISQPAMAGDGSSSRDARQTSSQPAARRRTRRKATEPRGQPTQDEQPAPPRRPRTRATTVVQDEQPAPRRRPTTRSTQHVQDEQPVPTVPTRRRRLLIDEDDEDEEPDQVRETQSEASNSQPAQTRKKRSKKT